MQFRILPYERQNFRLPRHINILEERPRSVQARLTFQLKPSKYSQCRELAEALIGALLLLSSCLQKGVDKKNLKFLWKWIFLLHLLLEVLLANGKE